MGTMIAKIVLVVVLSAGVGSEGGSDSDHFQREMEKLPELRDFEWVSDSSRLQLISEARTDLNSDAASVRLSAVKRLVALSDERTLEDLARKASSGDANARFLLVHNGYAPALPYLAGLLYTSDAAYKKSYVSDLDLAVTGFVRVVARSKRLPAPTRKWAQLLVDESMAGRLRLGPAGEGTRNVREWWEHNKKRD